MAKKHSKNQQIKKVNCFECVNLFKDTHCRLKLKDMNILTDTGKAKESIECIWFKVKQKQSIFIIKL